MKAVEAAAPTRIDLAGGTLDIPPLDLLVPGACTVNVAIDLEARARVEPVEAGFEIRSRDRGIELSVPDRAGLLSDGRLPLLSLLLAHLLDRPGARLTTDCASPAGAGLGGSSALAVAVTAALARYRGRPLDAEGTLAVSRDVETQVLRVPTGVQDYLAALRGGALALSFPPGGRRTEPLEVDPVWLRDRLVLVYSGRPRSSGINNWEVTRGFLDGDATLARRLEEIARRAAGAREALERADEEGLAAAMEGEWRERRKLGPGVTTPAIDALLAGARAAGARAGKACGAGGGGCVVLLCRPGSRRAVEEAVAAAGMEVLGFSIAAKGVRVDEVAS